MTQAPVHQPPDGAAQAVLYVEDQPLNVMLMQALFERRPDLRLVVAMSGKQAHTVSTGLSPALLLLDLRLPDTHGSTLLPQLRSRFGWDGVPAIAVTAELDFAVEGSGFQEVWTKPLDISHVLKRLDALVVRREPSLSTSG